GRRGRRGQEKRNAPEPEKELAVPAHQEEDIEQGSDVIVIGVNDLASKEQAAAIPVGIKRKREYEDGQKEKVEEGKEKACETPRTRLHLRTPKVLTH
ncbi:hypothetical protein KEM55_007726, partial [Ascosphaera atra]